MTTDTHERLRIEAQLDRVAEARALVRGFALDHGAPEVCVDDVVQAVDEALTNVIVHGYDGRDGTIDVTVARDGDTLEITLVDDGPPFDPTAVPEPDLAVPPHLRRPGGMGIHLMRLATDSIAHEARPGGGNMLTMRRRMDPRPKEER